jgi:hypothetical protein
MLRLASAMSTLMRCVAVLLTAASPAALADDQQAPGAGGLTQGNAGALAAAGQEPSPQFQGSDNCTLCHAKREDPSSLPRDFCRLDELTLFSQHDKHALAYQNLKWARDETGKLNLSELICQRLGIKDISTAQECLGCHAHWLKGRERPRNYVEGVSCESCHGPSSLWVEKHWNQANRDWRVKPAQEKAALGMVDVRDPVARARQCFSCHIGDAAQGKWVSHAMYAAGHPPLPGIELATFLEAMPVHWRNIREKGHFEKRAEYLAATFPATAAAIDQDLPRTKAVLVGGIMALRQSLALLADLARPQEHQPAGASEAFWPEFSAFDCQACHHELKPRGFRQARPLPGRPGRPRNAEWTMALVRAALGALAADNDQYATLWSEFEARLARLNAALDRVPFGEPGEVARAIRHSDGLLAWLDARAESLSRSVVDEARARRALERLLDLKHTDLVDFHSARQIAWALRMIQSERAAGYPDRGSFAARTFTEEENARRGALDAADLKLLDDWRQAQWQSAFDQTTSRLEQLPGLLLLELPAGVKRSVDLSQPEFLKRISDYDAGAFSKQIRQFSITKDH